MRRSHSIGLGLAGALMTVACIGNDAGSVNPTASGGSAKTSVQFKAISTAPLAKGSAGGESLPSSGVLPVMPPLIMNDLGGLKFNITEARLHVKEVEFKLMNPLPCSSAGTAPADTGDEAEDECEENNDELEMKGSFVVDLVAGTSSPSLTEGLVPSAMYKGIELDMEAIKTEGVLPAGDELLGHTMLLKGTFTYGDSTLRKFSIALDFDEELEIENPAGFSLDAGSTNKVVAAFNVGGWFMGLDIKGCLDSGDIALDESGNLTIHDDNDRGKCQDIRNLIKNNIKQSGEVEDEAEEDDDEDDVKED